MAKTLLEAVRSRLENSKVPLRQIAAAADVSERSLYYLIQGKHSPRWKTLEAVQDALNRLAA